MLSRGPITLGAALLAAGVLAGGCGSAPTLPAASFRPAPSTACHASPPDVVASIADATSSPGDGSPGNDERAAENKYYYAHWDVSGVPVAGGDYDYQGFTGDAQKYLSELRRQVPQPQIVRAYCAPFSMRTMDRVRDEVIADASMLHQRYGIVISQVIDEDLDGLVDVFVIHRTDAIDGQLRSRYGDVIGKVSEAVGGCIEGTKPGQMVCSSPPALG